jgi:hypothetical protein
MHEVNMLPHWNYFKLSGENDSSQCIIYILNIQDQIILEGCYITNDK